MRTLKIAHLYPELLNIYGDYGNILTLRRRYEWRNGTVKIDNINIGDSLSKYDIYFMGGGQDLQQIEVSNDIQRHRDFLLNERDRGAVFLAICGGYQLLGNYYQPHEGNRLEGLGLIDAHTIAGNKRYIGNVTVKTELVTPNTLVGFENHSGLTYLHGDTKPIGNMVVGNGNNGSDKGEGAKYKNVFGTYMHGSFLPKNTHFADYLIELAIGEKLAPINDCIEELTHNALVGKSY